MFLMAPAKFVSHFTTSWTSLREVLPAWRECESRNQELADVMKEELIKCGTGAPKASSSKEV